VCAVSFLTDFCCSILIGQHQNVLILYDFYRWNIKYNHSDFMLWSRACIYLATWRLQFREHIFFGMVCGVYRCISVCQTIFIGRLKSHRVRQALNIFFKRKTIAEERPNRNRAPTSGKSIGSCDVKKSPSSTRNARNSLNLSQSYWDRVQRILVNFQVHFQPL
jgi:hypothetical protein